MATIALNRSETYYYPGTTTESGRKYRIGWKSVPRADTPLAYSGQHTRCDLFKKDPAASYTSPTYSTSQLLNIVRGPDPLRTRLQNRVLLDLQQEKLGVDGSLGASLAEVMDSFTMVALRAAKLRKAYKHLRKGNFRKFCKELSVRPKPKHEALRKSVPKDASSLWLEYWFGWAPLVSDVGYAIDRLQNPFPVFSVHAQGSEGFQRSTGNPSATYDELVGKVFCKMGCDAQISNPNLYLANQLGFVNPAGVAWELVPMSFIVDWFIPVGDFINSFTAYLGLNITRPYSTMYVKASTTRAGRYGSSVPYSWFRGWYTHAFVERVAQLPSFSLTVDLPNATITRAATSISLLISVFTGKARGN